MSPTPIEFTCEVELPGSAEEFCGRLLELERWSDFRGWGPLPGIRRAEFERCTEDILGTRIKVTNRDSSTHVEEIVEWNPERRVALRMSEFSAPLSTLASHFEELWDFRPIPGPTPDPAPRLHATRRFRLYPRSRLARLPLRLIAVMLKRAVARHLRDLAAEDGDLSSAS